MIKIKVFSSTSSEDLEKKISQFLLDNPRIELLKMAQSESGKGHLEWAINVTIFYKKIGS